MSELLSRRGIFILEKVGLDKKVSRSRPDLHSADTALLIAVIVPGNRVLPFGDLATIGFFIAIAVAVHHGNLFRTLFSGSFIMFMTIWIANQTIPWMTALAKTTGATDGSNPVAALDQGGSPLTYIYTQICTRENLTGLAVIGAVYAVCIVFAIRCSKKRAAALDKDAD